MMCPSLRKKLNETCLDGNVQAGYEFILWLCDLCSKNLSSGRQASKIVRGQKC